MCQERYSSRTDKRCASCQQHLIAVTDAELEAPQRTATSTTGPAALTRLGLESVGRRLDAWLSCPRARGTGRVRDDGGRYRHVRATMKSHSCLSVSARENSAGPIARTGFTEVPVSGNAHQVDYHQDDADGQPGECRVAWLRR